MTFDVKDGMLILDMDGKSYSFEAHGEPPRPSQVVHDDGRIAWYTQEFLPDGNDYKFGKKAAIYLGNMTAHGVFRV